MAVQHDGTVYARRPNPNLLTLLVFYVTALAKMALRRASFTLDLPQRSNHIEDAALSMSTAGEKPGTSMENKRLGTVFTRTLKPNAPGNGGHKLPVIRFVSRRKTMTQKDYATLKTRALWHGVIDGFEAPFLLFGHPKIRLGRPTRTIRDDWRAVGDDIRAGMEGLSPPK